MLLLTAAARLQPQMQLLDINVVTYDVEMTSLAKTTRPRNHVS